MVAALDKGRHSGKRCQQVRRPWDENELGVVRDGKDSKEEVAQRQERS
jgi:hypothetical protein